MVTVSRTRTCHSYYRKQTAFAYTAATKAYIQHHWMLFSLEMLLSLYRQSHAGPVVISSSILS